MGLISIVIVKSVYVIEDLFEKLPLHWMWWPAIGGIAVGIIGYFAPATMGVGYDNIDRILSGNFVGVTLAAFCVLRNSPPGRWRVGSGTSGGTLAPLLTIGGALGVLIGEGLSSLRMVLDLRMAALVGMAACFAGSSRALFASIVFALEVSQQFNALMMPFWPPAPQPFWSRPQPCVRPS